MNLVAGDERMTFEANPGVSRILFRENTFSGLETRYFESDRDIIYVRDCLECRIFRYRDYRRYLADVYAFRKNSEYGFRIGAFSRRLELARPTTSSW